MYIKVRAQPGAKREEVKQLSEDEYEIAVREKAERNEANRRITEILKEYLSAQRIRLVSGHRSHTKIFDIVDQ